MDTASFAGLFWTTVAAVIALGIFGVMFTVLEQHREENEEERRREALNKVCVRYPRRVEK